MNEKSSKMTKLLREEEITGTQDAERFQEFRTDTFPEELLEMIFLNLDTCEDNSNVSNSCAQFRHILHPSNPKWVFSGIFPLLFKELHSTDILNCRLVCNKWKEGVDSFVQIHPPKRVLEPYPFHPTRRQITQSPANFTNNSEHSLQFTHSLIQQGFVGLRLLNSNIVRDFISDMDRDLPDQGNPFVLRDVYISNSLFPYFPTIYESHIELFLFKFGHHIWHISVDLPPTRSPAGAHFSYMVLRCLLLNMPNLRTLRICGGTDSPRDPNRRRDLIRIPYWKRYIRSHPLPPLPHLQLVEELIGNKSDMNVAIVDAVLQRYSTHLRKICLSIRKEDANPLLINLPQVREICLCLKGRLLEWTAIVPNLAKLSLQIRSNFQIRQVLSYIEENFQSLVYLKLCFLKIPRNDPEIEPSFSLERVKTLEILHALHVPYDVILSHLPSLEYLLICLQCSYQDADKKEFEGTEIFEIHKWLHSGGMYKSNIWKKITLLKEITVGKLGKFHLESEIISKKQYTRDRYNYTQDEEITKDDCIHIL